MKSKPFFNPKTRKCLYFLAVLFAFARPALNLHVPEVPKDGQQSDIRYSKIPPFRVVVLQVTAKKCVKMQHARAGALFSLIKPIVLCFSRHCLRRE